MCANKIKYVTIICIGLCLAGCLGTMWSSANLIYDRNAFYKQMHDYEINTAVHQALLNNHLLNQPNCLIDTAVFNGDILLAGHVSTAVMKDRVMQLMSRIPQHRTIYNQITVQSIDNNEFLDSWITGEIRSQIFTDATISPKAFKIVTADQIVYLMGDVQKSEAQRVITIARNTGGVQKVISLLKLYQLQQLSTRPSMLQQF